VSVVLVWGWLVGFLWVVSVFLVFGVGLVFWLVFGFGGFFVGGWWLGVSSLVLVVWSVSVVVVFVWGSWLLGLGCLGFSVVFVFWGLFLFCVVWFSVVGFSGFVVFGLVGLGGFPPLSFFF